MAEEGRRRHNRGSFSCPVFLGKISSEYIEKRVCDTSSPLYLGFRCTTTNWDRSSIPSIYTLMMNDVMVLDGGRTNLSLEIFIFR